MRIPNLSLYLRMVEFEFETEYKFEFETENKIFCEYQPWVSWIPHPMQDAELHVPH